MPEVAYVPSDGRDRWWSLTIAKLYRIKACCFIWIISVMIFLKLFFWVTGALISSAPAQPPTLEYDQFRRSRNLVEYLNNIEVLIKPPSTVCEGSGDVRLVVLVASAPPNAAARDAIRRTWGKHLPTFFVLGLTADEDETLEAMTTEATSFSDMVVYDFVEQRANQTLKTALMLRWVRRRCPQAGAVFRARDDVLVNPWAMDGVLRTHPNADLIGYKSNNSKVTRDEDSEWFLPKWLFHEDTIPEYLKGTGYIIKGDQIERILTAAEKIPLHNLEDVYFTYNVAKVGLNLTLDHDQRLKPQKPWFHTTCSYWVLASTCGLAPDEMVEVWSKVAQLAEQSKKGDIDCSLFHSLFQDNFILAAIKNKI